MHGKTVLTIIFIVIAAVAVLYGIVVLSAKSGTPFFMVWFFTGAGFLALAAFTHFKLYEHIPVPARIICLALIGMIISVFAYTHFCILIHFNDRAPDHLDYIIVLGAQMRSTGPSRVLKFRLDTAAEYLKNNPDTVCIVSGGQGSNEDETEAEGMKNYLIDAGIPEEQIIKEDEAGNTTQNILYSQKFLSSPDATVGIVSNNFHIYRGTAIAKKQGLTSIYGISAPSSPRFLPNNMLRESVGIIKDTLQGNMIPLP